jgi:hypothetical protein
VHAAADDDVDVVQVLGSVHGQVAPGVPRPDDEEPFALEVAGVPI